MRVSVLCDMAGAARVATWEETTGGEALHASRLCCACLGKA